MRIFTHTVYLPVGDLRRPWADASRQFWEGYWSQMLAPFTWWGVKR